MQNSTLPSYTRTPYSRDSSGIATLNIERQDSYLVRHGILLFLS